MNPQFVCHDRSNINHSSSNAKVVWQQQKLVMQLPLPLAAKAPVDTPTSHQGPWLNSVASSPP